MSISELIDAKKYISFGLNKDNKLQYKSFCFFDLKLFLYLGPIEVGNMKSYKFSIGMFFLGVIYLLSNSLFAGVGVDSGGKNATNSDYLFIYKLSADETEEWIKHRNKLKWLPPIGTKIDSVPLDQDPNINRYPSGNYLYAWAVNGQVNYKLASSSSYFITTSKIEKKNVLQIIEPKTTQIHQAIEVYQGKTLLSFNASIKAYELKGKRNSILKVVFKDHTIFLRLSEIRYRKHTKVNNKSEKSFVLFSKPKYKPLDTLKMKAVLLKKTGKFYRDSILIKVESVEPWSSKLEPLRSYFMVLPDIDGNVLLSFPIMDTLRFDARYNVSFYKGNRSNKKKRYLKDKSWKVSKAFLAEAEFYLEDYVLDEAIFNIKCDALYCNNEDVVLKISAFDQNKLPIKDGEVKLTWNLSGVERVKQDVTIPYSFNPVELKLEADGTTEFRLKKELFPKAKLNFRVLAEFTNSNNEYQTSECNFSYDGINSKINLKQVGKQFKVIEENEAPVIIYFSNNNALLDSIKTTSNQLIPYNPLATEYAVRLGGLSAIKKIPNAKISAHLKKYGDTISLHVENPLELYFTYSIFKNGAIIKKGSGEKLSEQYFDKSKNLYELEMSYLWKGKVNVSTYQCFEEDAKLFLDAVHSDQITPGEKIPITIQVKDSKNRPVGGVNVSAAAVNEQFKKSIYNEPVFNNYSEEGKYEKSLMVIEGYSITTSKEVNTRLKHEFNLDKPYYNILMPEGKFVQESYAIETNNCQFWPFIMKNKRPVPVQYILIDDTIPVYFSGTNGAYSGYSCVVPEGEHQVVIATSRGNIQIPTLNFKVNTKLVIAFSDSLVDQLKDLSYTKRSRRLNDKEKMMYGNHVARFRFKRKYRYGKGLYNQSGDIHTVNRTFRMNGYNKGSNFIGPILKGEKVIMATRDTWHNLSFQPNVLYTHMDSSNTSYTTITKNKKRIIKLLQYPSQKYFKKAGIPKNIGGVVNSSLADAMAEGRGSTEKNLTVATSTSKEKGTLLIAYKGNMELKLAHLNLPGYTGVVLDGVIEIHDIEPGDYFVFLYDKNQLYKYKSRIKINANTLEVVIIEDSEIEIASLFESFPYDSYYRKEYDLTEDSKWRINSFRFKLEEGSKDYSFRNKPFRQAPNQALKPSFTVNSSNAEDWGNQHYRRRRNFRLFNMKRKKRKYARFGVNNQVKGEVYHSVRILGDSYNSNKSKGYANFVSTMMEDKKRTDDLDLSYTVEVVGKDIKLIDKRFTPLKMRMRTNFKDEGFWQPKLKTDAKGEVKFMAHFPDNLTSWKTHFFALNEDYQYGELQTNIKAYKQLVASLSVPRFLLNGDTASVIGKTINYADDSVNIISSFKMNEELIEKEQAVNEIKIQSFKIVATNLDTLSLGYSVKSVDAQDGELRSIPIYPNGMMHARGDFHYLDKEEKITLIPEFDKNKYELFAAASGIDVMLDRLDKLQKYKHTCNEQNASKLSALLAEKRIKKKQGKAFTKEVKVKYLLHKLKTGRFEKGLWGWWKSSNKESVTVSIYVLSVLVEAREMGYAVKYLDDEVGMLYHRYERLGEREKLSVLLLFHQVDLLDVDYRKKLTAIESELGSMATDDLLMDLAILRKNNGMEVDYASLATRKKETVLGGYYWGEHAYNWYNNSAYATIRAMELFSDIKGYENLVSGIVNYFMEPGDDYKWRNTHESIRTIKGLAPYFLAEGQRKIKAPQISIIKNDVETVLKEFPIKKKYSNLSDTLHISKTGDGSVYLSLYTKQWNSTPLPKQDIFAIESKLMQNNALVEKLQSGTPAKLVVTIQVKKKANFVMLEIPIPAGCFYGDKISENFGIESSRDYRKNKANIYLETLDVGEYTFTINLEPRYKGSYHLNPVRAELMYFPIFYGNNMMKRITVE